MTYTSPSIRVFLIRWTRLYTSWLLLFIVPFNPRKINCIRTESVQTLSIKSILVPRGHDPFGQQQESRPLASSGRIPFLISNSKTIELTRREAASIMADSTPTKRYLMPVCRTSNQNIMAKNHPLDLFGPKATNEGIFRDLEKFCSIKIAFDDGFPLRIWWYYIL